MKKVLVSVLVVVALLLAAMPAWPVLAAGVFQQKTAPVDMKEPLIVTQLTEPVMPNPLWPGTAISWAFKVENISPRDYWVRGYVGVDRAKGNIWYTQELTSSSVSPAVKLDPYRGFILPSMGKTSIVITVKVNDDSPIATGVQFSPTVERSVPPQQG